MAAKPKAPDSRCDQGKEQLANSITITSDDLITLRLTLCSASYRVAVHLEDRLLFDNKDDELVRDELKLELDPLSPGLYGLSWSYMTNADPWKVRSEVLVNGAVRFRQRKGSASDIPFQHSYLLLRVR